MLFAQKFVGTLGQSRAQDMVLLWLACTCGRVRNTKVWGNLSGEPKHPCVCKYVINGKLGEIDSMHMTNSQA